MIKMVLSAPKRYEILKIVDGKKQTSFKSVENEAEHFTADNIKPHVLGYREVGTTTWKEIKRG